MTKDFFLFNQKEKKVSYYFAHKISNNLMFANIHLFGPYAHIQLIYLSFRIWSFCLFLLLRADFSEVIQYLLQAILSYNYNVTINKGEIKIVHSVEINSMNNSTYFTFVANFWHV